MEARETSVHLTWPVTNNFFRFFFFAFRLFALCINSTRNKIKSHLHLSLSSAETNTLSLGRDTLFNKPDSFLPDLVQAQVQNVKTLHLINNYTVATRDTYTVFGAPFLIYLIDHVSPTQLLVKLSCMIKHMVYLADNNQARYLIFSFCLKVR